MQLSPKGDLRTPEHLGIKSGVSNQRQRHKNTAASMEFLAPLSAPPIGVASFAVAVAKAYIPPSLSTSSDCRRQQLHRVQIVK